MTARKDSIQRDFERFHSANPRVYVRILELARSDVYSWQHTRPGQPIRLSMKRIFEDLRGMGYEYLDNRYTSRYSRLLMEREPDLIGLFETRGLSARASLSTAEGSR